MKNGEGQTRKSGGLVPGAEPRAEEGGEAGSFLRDAPGDAPDPDGLGPPRPNSGCGESGGGGSLDENLGGGRNNDQFSSSRGLGNLGVGESFARPGEIGVGGASSGGSVAVLGSGEFGKGGQSSPGGGEHAGRGGGGGSGIAGGRILISGGGQGRGRESSSRGGHAESARSQGRGFVRSTSGVRSVRIGSGGVSNGRGGGPPPHSNVRGGTAEPPQTAAWEAMDEDEREELKSILGAEGASDEDIVEMLAMKDKEAKDVDEARGPPLHSNVRGETAEPSGAVATIPSGGGERYAAVSGFLAQTASDTNSIDSGRAGGVELKSAEEQEGMDEQEGVNNNAVLTEINSAASSSELPESPPEEKEILDNNNNSSNMIDLVAGEAQGQEGRGAGSRFAPPPGYSGLPRAGTGSVAANPPANNIVSGLRLSPDVNTSAAAVLPFGGPEFLGSDDEEPLLPIGMIGTTDGVGSSGGSWQPDGAAKPHLEIDVDNARPPPLPSKMEAILEDVGIPAKYLASHTPDQGAAAGSHHGDVDGYDASTPYNSAEFDDDDGHSDKKKSAARTGKDEEAGLHRQGAETSGGDSICDQRNEEPEVRVPGNTRGPADIAHRINNNDRHLGIGPMDAAEDGYSEDENDQGNAITGPELQDDSTVSGPTIPGILTQAYLVDDDVVVATPLVPADPPTPASTFIIWWKQPNAKRFLALICLVATALAIALGIYFSTNNDPNTSPGTVAEVISVLTSSPPSTSIAPTPRPTTALPTVPPSILPSTLPSVNPSPSPSSSPTECAHQIASEVQAIDLQVSNPSETPEVAVDGRSMVAIVEDSSNSVTYTRFYSLRNDEWIVRDTFLEDHDNDSHPRVSLSGRTAFVGSAYENGEEGLVSVYGQNLFGDWDKVEELLLHDVTSDNATVPDANNIDNDKGTSSPTYSTKFPTWAPTLYPTKSLEDPYDFWVNIDGDLACVSDSVRVNLFHRSSTQWVQFKRIDSEYATCSIAGHTIAIEGQNSDYDHILLLYKYDSDLGRVVLLQQPISANIVRMSLSNDHLVFSTSNDDGDDIFIYRREDANQEFTLHQQIGGSYSGRYIPFAFDEDILVIGGNNHTHIFSDQDGRWEESITLDRSYEDYQLSGRMLLATNKTGVYSFNIEGCTQPVPTSIPSAAPTSSPSSSPSSPPSQPPSSTSSPSTSLRPSHSAVPSLAPSTSSNPSLPQITLSPSVSPSSSLSPSETCFFVEIDVLTDQLYYETWWDVASVTTVNGAREKNVVYDSSTIEVKLEGETLGAAFVVRSATDTLGKGELCNCVGWCDCQGQVCLVELLTDRREYWGAGVFIHGDNWLDAEIITCKRGGGVAAIIYDNVEQPLWSPWGRGDMPVAFVSQEDGRYLLEYGLGKTVSMTASRTMQFEERAPHSRRVCLPEGDYEFTIYDRGGDGINRPGYYKVSSNGTTVKEGAEFGSEESTPFSLPFLLAPALV